MVRYATMCKDMNSTNLFLELGHNTFDRHQACVQWRHDMLAIWDGERYAVFMNSILIGDPTNIDKRPHNSLLMMNTNIMKKINHVHVVKMNTKVIIIENLQGYQSLQIHPWATLRDFWPMLSLSLPNDGNVCSQIPLQFWGPSWVHFLSQGLSRLTPRWGHAWRVLWWSQTHRLCCPRSPQPPSPSSTMT